MVQVYVEGRNILLFLLEIKVSLPQKHTDISKSRNITFLNQVEIKLCLPWLWYVDVWTKISIDIISLEEILNYNPIMSQDALGSYAILNVHRLVHTRAYIYTVSLHVPERHQKLK